MEEYKRSTNKEYLNKPKCFNCEHNYSNCSICERHCVDGDCFQLREELKRLVQLEDKIENGMLKFMPCKVGDRIWVILGNNIFGRKVKSIVIRDNGYTIKTSNTNGWKELEPYCNTEFGVKWFLTKAKAEEKLKEKQNER